MHYVPVVYLFGWLLAILSGFMLIPVAIALSFNEAQALTSFLVGGSATAFLGGLLILSLWGRVNVISRSESLVLFIALWIVMPVFASVPIFMSGHTPDWTGAYFETVSGLTTTGATIFTDISELPNSIIAWRSLLQWLGGLLTLIGLAFFYGSSGQQSFQDTSLRLRKVSRGDSGWFSLAALNIVLPLYSALTAICFTLLVISGIPAFDAFCIAMSTVSSGGFMPRNGTIESYGTITALPIMALFMYLSAVSVFWVRRIFSLGRREGDRQREPWWIAAVILVLAFVLAVPLIAAEPMPGLQSLLNAILFGLATATSLITTTGYLFTDRLADAVPFIALLAICFVGGGRMSTAGGLKFHRMGAMLHTSGQEFHRLIYPHGVISENVSTSKRGNDPMRAIWSNFAILLIIVALTASILSLAGLTLPAALLAAVSALGNIGPAYELVAIPGNSAYATFSELESFAQITLSFVMIAGRIEILALLSLINFAYWQS